MTFALILVVGLVVLAVAAGVILVWSLGDGDLPEDFHDRDRR